MSGRYGFDKLNLAIAITAIAISVIGLFIPVQSGMRWVMSGLTTVLLALVIFRMISRNIPARQRELHIYYQVVYKIKQFFYNITGGLSGKVRDFKKYKRFSCPHCGQKLRVPRGKGKVRVTCAKCGNKFEGKS